MQVVSNCPRCSTSYGWMMNQVERAPGGGLRPVKSPNCPRCGYDVTGTNERAERNFHYYAKTNDADAIRSLIERRRREVERCEKAAVDNEAKRKRLNAEYEQQLEAYQEAKKTFRPGVGNLFGLLKPKKPNRPRTPKDPKPSASADFNAPVEGQAFNPIIVAAIYGHAEAVSFFLDNGVDVEAVPVALDKAKQYEHRRVVSLLESALATA